MPFSDGSIEILGFRAAGACGSLHWTDRRSVVNPQSARRELTSRAAAITGASSSRSDGAPGGPRGGLLSGDNKLPTETSNETKPQAVAHDRRNPQRLCRA